jgi:serine/threonine-protein kinase HipA
MANGKLNIYVFAHWKGMPEPKMTGVLSAHYAKGKKAFSFGYDRDWIKSEQQLLLDPKGYLFNHKSERIYFFQINSMLT